MVHQQDAVGLVCFDEKVRTFLPPKTKRSHLTDMLGALAAIRPAGQTHLADALHEVAERVRKRSLVILLSDLLADQQKVVDALHHMKYRGHDLIVLQVLDYSEATFDFDGQVRFEEPETGETLDTDPRAAREAYLRELEAFIDEYRRRCRGVRADYTCVHNAMTFDKALIEFLAQRQARM